MKNKKKIILPVFLVLILFVVGISFALWQITYTQTGTNVVTTDCFKVTFEDDDPINIEEAYPISDEEGRGLTPYRFTLTNMCDSFATYDINIETLNTSTLGDLDHIKIMLNETEQEDVARLLSSSTQVEKTLDNATTSHKIGTGYLDYKESKTFELRLWMDEETPLDEKYMSKTLENKVTIVTSFTSDMPLDTRNMMMERYDENNADNYDFMNLSTGLVFRNKKTNPTDVEVIDISYNKDNSVVAYNDSSSGKTITYIEANGKIKFPANSKYLLRTTGLFTNIDGLEYVDTRQVISMDCMFFGYKGTILNLSNFDTSNVTNMNSMFNSCRNLISLDLSNFNTKNVTDMAGMFSGCSSLSVLDLSNFDTSKVIYMRLMFYGCSSLTSLDLGSFDTSQVTDMSYMFYSCRNLISLDLSGFNTSRVTNMDSMFNSCRNLISLDLSGFNTSQVTNMNLMFNGCKNLVASITIKNIGAVSYVNMFGGAANLDGSQVTVNYTSETEELVDKMIATKTTGSNVVKGVKVD